jgi:outer membrane protein assembly factor BamB
MFMNKLLIVAAALVAAVVVAPVTAEDPTRLYTHPSLPPKDALDRLRLTTAWAVTVPTDGRRDGLYSVQFAPRGGGLELLIQTRSGGVTSLDAETGRVRWSTRVGTPYQVAQTLAYNRDGVYVINNIELYGLDRETGKQRWKYDMPQGAAAPPVADEEQIYLSLSNGRFTIYSLPNLVLWEKLAREGKVPGSVSALEAARVRKGIDLPAIGPLSGAREAYRSPPTGPQPTERTFYVPEDKIEKAPLLAQDRVLLPGSGRQIVGLAKASGRPAWGPVLTRGRLALALGQHEDTAYIASSDFNVYALNITGGQLRWRTSLGGQPRDRLAVLDDDVYVAADRAGLLRLKRSNGDELWRNEDAARFLSANKSFVYAADHHGRLLVLDRDRGTTLSSYNGTSDFVYPIANEWTDRIFLAANDGLIVCLRDRDAVKPVAMKTPPKERAPAPPPKPGLDGGKPGPDGGKPDGGKPDGGKPKAGDGMKP